VSLIHLVPSSYIVSLKNCMNEEYWRLAGTRFARLAGGGNGIQLAFRYNHRLLPADELYGQGMSVAAQEARFLPRQRWPLASCQTGTDDLPTRFGPNVRRWGTGGSQTHPWRETDSNPSFEMRPIGDFEPALGHEHHAAPAADIGNRAIVTDDERLVFDGLIDKGQRRLRTRAKFRYRLRVKGAKICAAGGSSNIEVVFSHIHGFGQSTGFSESSPEAATEIVTGTYPFAENSPALIRR
jgi:hypothetical protein